LVRIQVPQPATRLKSGDIGAADLASVRQAGLAHACDPFRGSVHEGQSPQLIEAVSVGLQYNATLIRLAAKPELRVPMSETQLDLLRSIAFFRDLDHAGFAAVSAACRPRRYAARELIIGHKDESFDVLFLLSGLARVSIYAPTGRQVSFRDIRPGAIFGELAAIDGRARSASVECIEPGTAAIMPQKAFVQALGEHPVFMMAVMRHLTEQVRNLTARVFEFSTLAVRNRVQAELLRLAGTPPPHVNEVILSPAPTHAEIASRVSTHREAVTRELRWLEEQGVIVKRGRTLRIADLDKLRRLLETFSGEHA
jgi:CRP/FNR family transcriptional regulator, cyclic AMP receptor protein